MNTTVDMIKDYIKKEYGIDFKIETYGSHRQLIYKNKKKEYEFYCNYAYQVKEDTHVWSIYDDFIDRYQRGCRSKSLMERISSRKFKGKDGSIHSSSFRLNELARTLLLSGKLHRVSPKCCYYLKKKTAHDFEKESGLKAILGIRGNEGALRKAQYKTCFTKDMKFTPIHDLSDELLNAIYEKYNIEIPKVYQYIKRSGCMGCVYGHYKGDTQKELDLLNDNQRKFVIEYFKESYQVLGININKQLNIYDYLGGNDEN